MKDLPRLLSQALVALTVEIDNEVERRMANRTTDFGPSSPGRTGPWLISLAMYDSCLKQLPPEGTTVTELERRTRTNTNIGGMLRWGYLKVVQGDVKKNRADAVIRPSRAGLLAQRVCREAVAAVEQRWNDRFGPDEVFGLRSAVIETVNKLDVDLPDYLPIVFHDMVSRTSLALGEGAATKPAEPEPPLYALLSKVLLAYALRYETGAKISLPIAANFLRVLSEEPMPQRDLPLAAGISKEAVQMALGRLVRSGYASLERAVGGRGEAVRLTASGLQERETYRSKTLAIERKWPERFGEGPSAQIHAQLQRIVGDGRPGSPIFEGLKPFPDGWRAKVPPPQTLPHYPMILHRGGYPDGS